MKYCSQCGSSVEHRVPEGDNRPRHVCSTCGEIHYSNPRIVAGTIPSWQGKVLLCKRAIEPRYGYWTLPAGFMENAETTTEAAIRETREEALAEVEVDGLFTMVNVPHIDQVHLFFRATLIDGRYGVGEESLDTQLFAEEEVPWEELAFPTVKETLKHFFEDRRREDYQVRVSDIRKPLRPK